MGRSHCAREQCVVHSALSDVGPRSAQKHFSAQLAVFRSGVTPRGPIFHLGGMIYGWTGANLSNDVLNNKH
eukprot:5253635-Heterocapsa_arctica.AAC.1